MGQNNRHPFCWLVDFEGIETLPHKKKKKKEEEEGKTQSAAGPHPHKKGKQKKIENNNGIHRAVQRAASASTEHPTGQLTTASGHGRTARLRCPPHGRPAAGRPTLLRQSPRPGALPAAFGAVSADFFWVEVAGFGSVVFEAISTFEYSLLGPLKKLSISSKQRDPSGMEISKPEPSTCARGPLHGSLSREQPLNLEPRSNKPPP